MNITIDQQRPGRVIIGIDTHKDVHVAAALDQHGVLLGIEHFEASARGYQDLGSWARDWQQDLGAAELTYGIEGTGSYGAGLVAALRGTGGTILEVGRPNRRDRRLRGKTDAYDAENAARSILAGTATGVPKTADGRIEMIRVVKSAKRAAVKARTTAMIGIKNLVVTAPEKLRGQLRSLTKMALIRRCAAFHPGPLGEPRAAVKYALRASARRWLYLDAEIKEHEALLDELTQAIAPALRQGCGIGPDAAAEILTVAGDNFWRITSEAALAKLCGVNPIPASSGKTHRHRLNRGGHRQANASLHRIVIVRMRIDDRTKAYLERRTAEGKTKLEIIRCLKRHLIREIWRNTKDLRLTQADAALAA